VAVALSPTGRYVALALGSDMGCRRQRNFIEDRIEEAICHYMVAATSSIRKRNGSRSRRLMLAAKVV